MKRPRLLAADDHSIVMAGIRALIEHDWELVGQVDNGQSLVEEALSLRPDLIILDIGLPVLNGIDAARQIRLQWPEAKLLFLTMHANRMYLREAMRVGGLGYVLKTSAAEELKTAIQRVLKGQVYISPSLDADALEDLRTPGRHSASIYLTDRQRQVLQLVAEGATNREIARILSVSIKTAQFHRGQIMRKLGVHSSVKLAAYAVKEGLISG